MRHPINYQGTYPTNWAGYTFKEKLGYTSGRHTGVDYNHGTDDFGDPIYAPCNGKVVGKIPSGRVGGFGNAMIIEVDGTPPKVVGNKMYMRFLHMNTIEVSVGQQVVEGQRIGTVGVSGGVPAHLHFDIWTDRNGLGVHWKYHKDTALASYEDGFKLIENNKNWNIGEPKMTTAEEANAYKIVLNRKMEHAGSGRTGYKFILDADAELQAQRKATQAVINTLTAERNEARKQVGLLTSQKLKLEDELKLQKLATEAKTNELNETIKVYDEQIATLNKAIEIKDKEIARLSKELGLCQNNGGDIANKSGWELIALGLKKLLGKE